MDPVNSFQGVAFFSSGDETDRGSDACKDQVLPVKGRGAVRPAAVVRNNASLIQRWCQTCRTLSRALLPDPPRCQLGSRAEPYDGGAHRLCGGLKDWQDHRVFNRRPPLSVVQRHGHDAALVFGVIRVDHVCQWLRPGLFLTSASLADGLS